MAKKIFFGDLEQRIMERIWNSDVKSRGDHVALRDGLTVREVCDAVTPHHRVAYTTVMTVMNRLVARQLLKRRLTSSGAYLYSAIQTKADHSALASKQTVNQLVAQYGDAALVQFLEKLDTIPDDKLSALRRQQKGRSKA